MTRHFWARGLALATIAVALAGAAPACRRAEGMKKLEVPAGGILLAYDLTPGAIYDGHLRIGNTRQVEQVGNISQALECDVKLTVIGNDATRSGAQVRATLSNIDLQWGLPPSTPISPDEFLAQAIAQLQGMQVTFNVLPTGEITFMPVPPQDLSAELKELIYQVLRALEQGFLVVPKHRIDEGEAWTEHEKRGREGKLGRYIDGQVKTRVEGMFRDDERAEDVVRLVIEERRKETITTKDGAHTSESEGKSTALFSTKGYLAQIDGEARDYDPTQGMNFRKVRARWKKTAQGHDAPQGPEVQTITDPCHPDYVGPQECTDGSEAQTITDPCHADYVGTEVCKQAPPVEGAPPVETVPPAEPGKAAPPPT
ncbi:MAG TPA: hypothetical protein VFG69_00200 [Nannocystaceae bacterium]|nr:hypothetical protein [Nannocystaceae bacterium]